MIKLLINKDNYMTGITMYLSILTLNVYGLNSPIKRHQLANWIKKEDPTIYCLQETHLIDRNKHWLRVKGWKKIYQANGPRKQAGGSNTYLRQSRFQTYIDHEIKKNTPY
jgi:exonuclease III